MLIPCCAMSSHVQSIRPWSCKTSPQGTSVLPDKSWTFPSLPVQKHEFVRLFNPFQSNLCIYTSTSVVAMDQRNQHGNCHLHDRYDHDNRVPFVPVRKTLTPPGSLLVILLGSLRCNLRFSSVSTAKLGGQIHLLSMIQTNHI